jgi:hypothetical protein
MCNHLKNLLFTFPDMDFYGVRISQTRDGTWTGNNFGRLTLNIERPDGKMFFLEQLTASECGQIIGRSVFHGAKLLTYKGMDVISKPTDLDLRHQGYYNTGLFDEVTIEKVYEDGRIRERYHASGYIS